MTRWFRTWQSLAVWDRCTLAGGLIVFTLAVWLFAELADDAPEGDYLAWEERVLEQTRDGLGYGLPEPWFTEAMVTITVLGDATALIAAAGIGAAWLLYRRRRAAAWFFVGALASGAVLTHTLKLIFNRDRPTAVQALVAVDDPSFPSGHAMNTAVCFLTFAFLTARHARSRTRQVLGVALALAASGAIGLTRIYLGVHYPTDVLAGWSAGTAWAILIFTVATRWDPLPDPRHPENAPITSRGL